MNSFAGFTLVAQVGLKGLVGAFWEALAKHQIMKYEKVQVCSYLPFVCFDDTLSEILIVLNWLCQIRVHHWIRICRKRDTGCSFTHSHLQGG